MRRMTVTVDENLLAEAQMLLKSRTKRETISRALCEIVRQKKREKALEHCGQIELDLDQTQLQELRQKG